MTTATATKSTTAKASKVSSNGNGKHEMDPKVRAERDAAKAKGLSLVHFRILKALNAGPLTYRGIEGKTGYYSILTAQLRKSHEGSLGALGLVNEQEREDGLTFAISAKGKKVIEK